MFELFGSQGATDLYFRSGLLPYYFGIMWLLVAYAFYKFKVDKWFWFVFLLFMPNSFEFLGIKLLYRVVLIFYTLFMFFSTKVFMELGGFDERFFMYLEDCDIARRVSKKYKALHYPMATVYHLWERESKRNKKLLLIHIMSIIKYFIKWGIRF